MADYNSDRTGSNIDAVLDKADNLTQAAVGVGGNVGIGTANPSAPLSLNRTVSDGTLIQLSKDGATVGSIGSVSGVISNFVFDPRAHADGTGIGLSASKSTGDIPYLSPRNGSGTRLDGSVMLGNTDNRFKDLYLSGDQFLRTSYLGSASGAGGNRFVHILGDANGFDTGYKIRSGVDSVAERSHVAFVNPNGIVGQIKTNGSATSYNTSSDYRLKENVSQMQDASSRVMALKPCRFNFTVDPDKTVDGFLAHEAQEVVPEAVHGTKDGMRTEEYEVAPAVLDDNGNIIKDAVMGTREVPDYQGIDQSKLVPLLTKALQEALQRIEILESK